MKLAVATATEADAQAVADLRNAVADDLTHKHGIGNWSTHCTERGVLWGMKGSRVLVARRGSGIIATLRLATKKPWAIDRAYFTPVRRPLYLVDMAVRPDLQRHGFGRGLLDEARKVAVEFPANAIWLDAYDGPAGAGPFYAKCGYREVGRTTYRGTPLVYFELVF
jgi:GNAT superfamily N-acetyltransferase